MFGTVRVNEVIGLIDRKLAQTDWKNGEVHPGSAPASAAAAGVAGTIVFESGFAYFCISTGVWQRVAIATW